MTHAEAIGVFLSAGRPEEAATDGAQAAAEDHVARCSDCWDVLAQIESLLTGEPPPDSAAMEGLFGCASLRDSLHPLVGLPASEIGRLYPDAARHLGWCLSCRERLAALVLADQAVATLPALAAGGWRRVTAAGERLEELIGTAILRIGRGLAGFVGLPDGWVVREFAPALTWRGEASPEDPSTSITRHAAVDLGDSGMSISLVVGIRGTERADLEVMVNGAPNDVLVQLRLGRGDRPTIVAAATVSGGRSVGFPGLIAGAYALDVLDGSRHLRFRLGFDVQLDT